ncbi:MAG: hypothetical protein QXV17_11730 [Candidatus Micrarchaeaceae archaeon]
MKFAEITEPSGGYKNTTSSYFLALGIAFLDTPSTLNTGWQSNQNGILIDPNGNVVDRFFWIDVNVSAFSSSMTVWNGTSMESEPYTSYTAVAIVDRKSSMLVPPQFTLKNFGYAIGFWLTFEETKEYLLKGNISVGKNIMENIQNWKNSEVMSK